MNKQVLKVFKLELALSNHQRPTVTIGLTLEVSNGEDDVVPGFEELWYSLDVHFEPALNNTIKHVPIALPGKKPDGEIINITLGHVAQAIAVTLKDKYDLDVIDLQVCNEDEKK